MKSSARANLMISVLFYIYNIYILKLFPKDTLNLYKPSSAHCPGCVRVCYADVINNFY